MSELITLEHPGEILLQEFMQPLEISAYRLAKEIGVPITRITTIIKGERAITADTALRLSRYFRMSDNFFLNLQKDFELRQARQDFSDDLGAIVPLPRPDITGKQPSP